MTSLFNARRSAEEFAAAVDREVGAGAHRSDLAPLVGVVTLLRSEAPVMPRDEFAADLRSRLLLEAETALLPGNASLALPVRTRGVRERRLVAAASAFVLIGGTTTMAAAAQSALPGDALYPIKRGIEQAQAGLSLSPAGKGTDLLHQANDRLSEVEGLLGDDAALAHARVSETLVEFRSSASEGSDLLFASFEETRDPAAIVEVRSFTADGITTLEGLADTVPTDAQDELAAAAVLLRDIDQQALTLCSGCAADLPALQVPGILLARADVDLALMRAATTELNNDHPVTVSQEMAARVRSAGRSEDEAAGPAQPAADEAPAPPAAPTPGPTEAPQQEDLPDADWSPDQWPTLVPDVTEETKTGGKQAPQAGDELGDAVKTLLPDADLPDADLP